MPPSSDPARDLVNRSVRGFRPFALEHPDLFRLFFTPQRSTAMAGRAATASRLTAYGQLVALVERVQRTGLLGSVSVEEATMRSGHALCTGLALREICGPIQRTEGDRIWTEALEALLRGLGLKSPAEGTGGGATAMARSAK